MRTEVFIAAVPADAVYEIMRLPPGDGLLFDPLPLFSAIVTIIIICARADPGMSLVIHFAKGQIAPALRDVRILMGTCFHIPALLASVFIKAVILASAGQRIVAFNDPTAAFPAIELHPTIARHSMVVGRRIAPRCFFPSRSPHLRVFVGAGFFIAAFLALAVFEAVALPRGCNLGFLFLIILAAIEAFITIPPVSAYNVPLCIAFFVYRVIIPAIIRNNPGVRAFIAALDARSIFEEMSLLHVMERLAHFVPRMAADFADIVRCVGSCLGVAVRVAIGVLYNECFLLINLRVLASIAAELAFAFLKIVRLIGLDLRFRSLLPGCPTGRAVIDVPEDALHNVVFAVFLRIALF